MAQKVERADKIVRSEDEWREILPAERYRVLREHGTEPAFRNEYWDEHREGTYHCGGCDLALFDSSAKFDSGTGWPSFYEPIADDVVEEDVDRTLGMTRTEVHCARCEGHLGHLFEDGPPPTGLRYCMNSASLLFRPSLP